MNLIETNAKLEPFNNLEPSVKKGIFELIEYKTSEDMKEVIGVLQQIRLDMKADMESFKTEMRADMESFKTEIRLSINSLRTEFKADIEVLRSEIKIESATLKAELAHGLNRNIIWTITTMTALLGIALAVIKIL